MHARSGLWIAILVALPRAAWAVDPFEIQVYDGTANGKGDFGLELHSNAVVRGTQQNDGPQLAQDHQLHFTFEPSFGITSWWELGGYFQTAIAAGSFDYGGVKLRSKLVTPPGWQSHLRLGVNLEVSLLPTSFDKNEWGGEIRPIIAWENAFVLLALNPIIGIPLAGPDFHLGPTFEPAAMAVYKFGERVSLGLEYYGDLGPLSAVPAVAEQAHYIFEVVNVLAIPHVEVNMGFGEGLTSGSNRFVAKLILGYTWERGPDKTRRARVFTTNQARE